MVALQPPEIVTVPLADVGGKQKLVPLDFDLVRTARAMGISFGRLVSEQLRVLLLLRVVDQLDVLVGDLLHLVEALPFVVLGDLGILQQLLQPVVRVAPDAADGVAAFFGQLVDVA